jgi:hypothetical protein
MVKKFLISVALGLYLAAITSCGGQQQSTINGIRTAQLNINDQVNNIIKGINRFDDNNSSYFYAYSTDDIYISNNFQSNNKTVWDTINYSAKNVGSVYRIAPFYYNKNTTLLILNQNYDLFSCSYKSIFECSPFNENNLFPIETQVNDILGNGRYDYITSVSGSIFFADKPEKPEDFLNDISISLLDTLKQQGLDIQPGDLKLLKKTVDVTGNFFVLFQIGEDKDKVFLAKYDVATNSWSNDIYQDQVSSSIVSSPDFVFTKDDSKIFFVPTVKDFLSCKNKHNMLFAVSILNNSTKKIDHIPVLIPEYDCSDLSNVKLQNITIDAHNNLYFTFSNKLITNVFYTNINAFPKA